MIRTTDGRFRASFRLILTVTLVAVLVGTVAVVGFVSYWNATASTESLLIQMLDSVSRYVDARVQSYLDSAIEESDVTINMFRTGSASPSDFRPLARYWLDVMMVHTNLTYLSIGLEKTGDMMYVTRLQDGSYSIRELLRNPATGNLELRDYRPDDYPERPYYVDLDHNEGDPRGRPWYVKAKREGRQVWSDTYVFLGVEGKPDVPGVTLATPVFDEGGGLVGVMSADFDVYSLCQFLAARERAKSSGFAFIVELREDGRRQVIAHPDPEILIRVTPGEVPRAELVPVDLLGDRVVQAFMRLLPEDDSVLNPKVQPVAFTVDGTDYLGGYASLRGPNAPRWLIGLAVEESEILGYIHRTNWMMFGIGLGGLMLAVGLSLYLASRISAPLEYLTRQADDIGRLHLEPAPDRHSSILEIDRLLHSAEEMKAGLRSFGKYVPREVVNRIIASGEEAVLGGRRQELTVFFADVIGFTSIAEGLEPEELVEILSQYNEALSREIAESGGTLDKYVGDAVMAFWGAPGPDPRHAERACRAALRCRGVLADLRAQWESEGKPAFDCRIGISTGELVVGNLGSRSRINYTVIGDPVNLAKRLEELNAYYGTRIMIGEETHRAAGEGFVTRPVDRVRVKGKRQPNLVYEVLAERSDAPGETAELAALYRTALERYFARDWEEAAGRFEEVLRIRPDDPPAARMLARCRRYREHPPPPGWDGVKVINRK